MSNVRIVPVLREEPEPTNHDRLCATIRAVNEGWVDCYSDTYCTCDYVRLIRDDERRALKKSIDYRCELLEDHWKTGMTTSRRAYLLGLAAATYSLNREQP